MSEANAENATKTYPTGLSIVENDATDHFDKSAGVEAHGPLHFLIARQSLSQC